MASKKERRARITVDARCRAERQRRIEIPVKDAYEV